MTEKHTLSSFLLWGIFKHALIEKGKAGGSMKLFIRRMNRGLILAAVILAGLVIYINVDNFRFREAKPDIKKQVENYLEEVKQVNLSPAEERVDQTKKLIETYWCDGKNGSVYRMAQMDRKETLEYLDHVKERGILWSQITEYTDVVQDIVVKKNGPGSAKAVVPYHASIGFENALGDEGYQIFGLQGDSYYYYGGTEKAEDGKRMNVSYSVTFLLYEKDGQWKIGGVSCEPLEEGM